MIQTMMFWLILSVVVWSTAWVWLPIGRRTTSLDGLRHLHEHYSRLVITLAGGSFLSLVMFVQALAGERNIWLSGALLIVSAISTRRALQLEKEATQKVKQAETDAKKDHVPSVRSHSGDHERNGHVTTDSRSTVELRQ